jgi:hypothetical protein
MRCEQRYDWAVEFDDTCVVQSAAGSTVLVDYVLARGECALSVPRPATSVLTGPARAGTGCPVSRSQDSISGRCHAERRLRSQPISCCSDQQHHDRPRRQALRAASRPTITAR